MASGLAHNRWLFRSVQGRDPGADNYFDQGSTKLFYNLDIAPLIESAKDGKVACDLTNGVDTNGDGKVDLTAIQARSASSPRARPWPTARATSTG